jgi:hypothetical protein
MFVGVTSGRVRVMSWEVRGGGRNTVYHAMCGVAPGSGARCECGEMLHILFGAFGIQERCHMSLSIGTRSPSVVTTVGRRPRHAVPTW